MSGGVLDSTQQASKIVLTGTVLEVARIVAPAVTPGKRTTTSVVALLAMPTARMSSCGVDHGLPLTVRSSRLPPAPGRPADGWTMKPSAGTAPAGRSAGTVICTQPPAVGLRCAVPPHEAFGGHDDHTPAPP